MESLFFYLGMTFVVLQAAGVLVMLIAIWSAPLGYEDETGFHFGPDPRSAAVSDTPLPPYLWYPMWGAF